MRFVTRPLEKWPRPETRNRTNGGYSVDYNRVLRQLERELMHLGVRGDVVIQMDITDREIRVDGTPYATARPRTPRIAISFTTAKLGPMSYYCDAHFAWQSNVRAIGLGLERLRLVEKTGIVARGEQYTGFRALPGGIPMPEAKMTLEEAAKYIAHARGRDDLWQHMCRNADEFRQMYRAAAAILHPDAGGQDISRWHQLQTAAEILKKHHNIA